MGVGWLTMQLPTHHARGTRAAPQDVANTLGSAVRLRLRLSEPTMRALVWRAAGQVRSGTARTHGVISHVVVVGVLACVAVCM